MNILDVLEEIGSDTKRSHKIALIEKYKDNKLFLDVIKLALDPYVNFYIRKIPDRQHNKLNECTYNTLEWALVELGRLTSREFTGHAGITHLSNILSNISADDATVVERIIGKDLRCGMADGIVNAVIKDFIPTYPCLLARPFDEKNIKNITYPAYSNLKADGVRVNFHVDGDKVSICGRSGRTIDLLGHMDADFIRLGKKYDSPHIFDGELLVVDQLGNLLSRKVGNGIINKAIKGTISDDEAKMIRAQLWDAIPLSEFRAGKSTKLYKVRFETLISAMNEISKSEDATVSALSGNDCKYWPIPYKIVNNLEEAVEHFELLLSHGNEGTILKNFNAYWEDSRSKHLVKMKAEKSCDLEIIGFNPGEGKFIDQVGSLICGSSDRKVEVSISGFSDELRLHITNNINSLMNTIVEVIYNERISSKDKNRSGVDSLFLPRFSCFRNDKFKADSTNEIK